MSTVASVAAPAAPSPAQPQTPSASDAKEFEFTADKGMPADFPRSPASMFAAKHGKDLLAINGAYSISWSTRDDYEVRVYVKNEQDAAMAAGLLEPKVGDIKLVVGLHQTRKPYDGPTEANVTDRVRSIASMPGVWDYNYRVASPMSNGRVTFSTVNQDFINRLDPLIRDKFDFGHTPKGRARTMSVDWKAHLPNG